MEGGAGLANMPKRLPNGVLHRITLLDNEPVPCMTEETPPAYSSPGNGSTTPTLPPLVGGYDCAIDSLGTPLGFSITLPLTKILLHQPITWTRHWLSIDS